MTLVVAGLLASGRRARPGWLEVARGVIAAAGAGDPPRTPDERHDGLIAPGFVDLQVNGAAGREVTDGPGALDAIDALLLDHGVTSYLATVVTTQEELAERAVGELAERIADPSSPLAGVHLEGPFLSPAHPGVHRTSLLRTPREGLPAAYSSPAVRLVTLAPELPGALELVGWLRERGVAVSLGHSGASAEQTGAAADAGACLLTHVFNAMAPLRHRDPGVAGAGLVDKRLAVSVIADGVHLHPVVLELIRRAAGERVVLVSDSSAPAGAPPGAYELAGMAVESTVEGEVRDRAGRLAGSALTLDAAVRNWEQMTAATLAQAVQAASERPAALIGRTARLAPGAPADLVLLDQRGDVDRVMKGGAWID